jgi:hypothetical protein
MVERVVADAIGQARLPAAAISFWGQPPAGGAETLSGSL